MKKLEKIATGLFAMALMASLLWAATETQLGNLIIKNYALNTTLQVETLLTRATLALKTASGTAQLYKAEGAEKIYSDVGLVLPSGYISSGGYFGIRTYAPNYALSLEGTAAEGDGISFQKSGYAHGITVRAPTDTFGSLTCYDTNGSLYSLGITKSLTTPPWIMDAIWVSNPTDGCAAIRMNASLKDGTGTQALSDTDLLFEIRNNTTPKLTITGVGEVGIGTNAPADYSQYADDLVILHPNGASGGLTIATDSTHAGNIFFADGTGASADQGYVQYSHVTDALAFGTADTTALTLDSSQDATFAGSIKLATGESYMINSVNALRFYGVIATTKTIIVGNGGASLDGSGGGGAAYQNTTLGYNAGLALTTSQTTTLIGADAGEAITEGYDNTCVGTNSGDTITTGDGNTMIGSGADASGANVNNETCLGAGATGQGANTIMLGNSSVTGLLCYDTTISSPSDESLKKDIEDYDLGLDFILGIKPKEFRYNWDESGSPKRQGFIAQEMQAALKGKKWNGLGKCIIDGQEKLALSPADLIPVLVNAMKEQQTQIEDLKARIEKLEKK